MGDFSVRAVRTVIAVLMAGCLLCQVFVVPWLAEAAVSAFPEAAPLQDPVAGLAVAVVAAVQLALVSLWPLLSLLEPATTRPPRHVLLYADILAGSLLGAALLQGTILHVIARPDMCPPAVGLSLLTGSTGCVALAALVIVGRWQLKGRGPLKQSSRSPRPLVP